MGCQRLLRQPIARCVMGGLFIAGAMGLRWQPVSAQLNFVTLATGFAPNPTVLRGTGGGDRPAADVVNTQQTPTGPCLGYISVTPHEEITLESRFSNLEMRVESNLDTTLVIAGPDGIWCNDDSGSHNPAIAGAWVPGNYRIWIGAYRPEDVPDYELQIADQS